MRGILSIGVTCTLLLASVLKEGASSTTASTNTTIDASITNSTAPTQSTAPTSTAPNINTTLTDNSTTAITTTDVAGNSTAGPSPTGTTDNATLTTIPASNTTGSNMTTVTSGPDVTKNTTETPAGPSNITTDTPSTARVCAPSVCGSARCLQLSGDYTCVCPLGFAFVDLSCHPGDTFYGELQITGGAFNSDQSSAEYTAIYNEVLNNMMKCFENNTNYLGTTIVELRQGSTKGSRNTDTTIATVGNIFGLGTESQLDVTNAINEYIKNEGGNIAAFSNSSICGVVCDDVTTTCEEYNNGQSALCTCKPDLHSSQTTITTCRECSPTCTAADGRQCKTGPSDVPQCVCLPGYKSKDNQCKACDFGYSGDECTDNYLLILVIVGAVLGGVVIILLGAVIGVSVSSKKRKSGERVELIDDKQEGSISAPGSLFPKVQMKPDLGQVNRASNVYEDDEEEYRRSIPKRDYDENPWYEMARKDRNY